LGQEVSMRRMILMGALLMAGRPVAAQEAPAPPAATIGVSDDERERFLLAAPVLRRRAAPGGVTNSERATLGEGSAQHDAHIQRIDEKKLQNALASGLELDFLDSFRNNVAAYRLDRLLGLGMVPVTVMRRDGLRPASFTWWVDDVLMDEKARLARKVRSPDVEAWNRQMYVVRVFDQLIFNFDRNLGNLLVDKDWRVWMIDHTRAFKKFKTLKSHKELGPRCARQLLASLRQLDRATLQRTMVDLLDRHQIDGLLARRDAIVRHYDARIATLGDEAVLYDFPSRFSATAASR
jgi:hypothetical protein